MKLKRTHYLFFILTGIYLIAGIPLLLMDKGVPTIWFNDHHTPVLDIFFKYYTNLGGGSMIAVILIFLLITNRRKFIIFGTASAIMSVIVQLLFKQHLFSHVVRPAKHFKGELTLNFVEGVNMHYLYSFPSGHTSLAFLIATSMVLFYPEKKIGILMFIYAFFIGISRIYLFQHFYIDTYFGTIIGTTMAVIVYAVFKYFENKKKSLN